MKNIKTIISFILVLGILLMGCPDNQKDGNVFPNSPYDVYVEPTSDLKRGDIITITYKLDKDGIVDCREDMEITEDYRLKYTGNDPACGDHVDYVKPVSFGYMPDKPELLEKYRNIRKKYINEDLGVFQYIKPDSISYAEYYESYTWGTMKVKIPENAVSGHLNIWGQFWNTGLSEDILYIHDESGDVIYSEEYNALEK